MRVVCGEIESVRLKLGSSRLEGGSMSRKGRRGGKAWKANKDKTMVKVLEKAFDSMSWSNQTLSVAEGTLEAIASFPEIVVDGCCEAASDIYYDVCAAYRGGKLRGTMKHKPATKTAVGLLIHLLQKKYGISLEDAAVALDLKRSEAKELQNNKKIQRALKDPIEMIRVLHGKKAAMRMVDKAEKRIKKVEDKAKQKAKALKKKGESEELPQEKSVEVMNNHEEKKEERSQIEAEVCPA